MPDTPALPSPEVPPSVRVELAHAAYHRMAQLAQTDVLIVKGPRMDPSVAYPGRASSDVDLLVRPAHLARLLAQLPAHGCRALDSFETGSPFGHSVTWHSPTWGHIDVHRFIPGIEVDPEVAFDRLWAERTSASFAGIPLPVPSPTAQAVVLVLHAARAGGDGRARADVAHAWDGAPAASRQAMLVLVEQLRAEVAWAAATGGLDAWRGRPTYRLWRAVSRGDGRLAEWRGRIAAASTVTDKARVVARGVPVNTDHLGMLLGRPPTRREVAVEQVRRIDLAAREAARAAVQLGRRAGRRRRRPPKEDR